MAFNYEFLVGNSTAPIGTPLSNRVNFFLREYLRAENRKVPFRGRALLRDYDFSWTKRERRAKSQEKRERERSVYSRWTIGVEFAPMKDRMTPRWTRWSWWLQLHRSAINYTRQATLSEAEHVSCNIHEGDIRSFIRQILRDEFLFVDSRHLYTPRLSFFLFLFFFF